MQSVTQLHSRGWVHGDLRPSNWLKSYDGFYRLTGLQNVVNEDGDNYDTPLLPLSAIDPPEKAHSEPAKVAQASVNLVCSSPRRETCGGLDYLRSLSQPIRLSVPMPSERQ